MAYTHTSGTFEGVGDCPLYYQVWRPGGPMRGVVALVHGVGEHSDRYPHLRDALTAAGYLLVAYDLRGHGRSDGPRGHIDHWEQLQGDLTLALAHWRTLAPGSPLFLYGHSLGALLVLDHLIQNAGRPNASAELSGLAGQGGSGATKGAVLSGAGLDASRVAPAWQRLFLTAMSRLWPAFAMQLPLSGALLSRDQEVAADYDSDPLVHWTRSARLAAEGFRAIARVQGQAARLHTPVLFLHGEADQLVPACGARAFCEAMPSGDKTLRILPGGYHEPHNDIDHTAVMAGVVAWLRERS